MKMGRTHLRALRQLVERRQVLGLLDVPADGDHHSRLPINRRGLIGPAALARAEPGLLGIRAGRVKPDILPQRLTRRTGRTAIHACRPDGIVEGTVRGRITGQDGRPTRVLPGVPVDPPCSRDWGGHRHSVHLGMSHYRVTGRSPRNTPDPAVEFEQGPSAAIWFRPPCRTPACRLARTE
jgi:hypothetical protein